MYEYLTRFFMVGSLNPGELLGTIAKEADRFPAKDTLVVAAGTQARLAENIIDEHVIYKARINDLTGVVFQVRAAA
jgi:hypothetical protein